MKSSYDSCKVLCLRHTHPLLPEISQGLTARKQFCWKDMVGSRPNVRHLCALAEKLTAYWVVAKRAETVDQGKRLLPFIQQLRGSIRNVLIVFQDLGTRSVYKEDDKVDKTWLRLLGSCSLEETGERPHHGLHLPHKGKQRSRHPSLLSSDQW